MNQTTISTIPKLISQVLAIYEVGVASVFQEAGIEINNDSDNNRISMTDMTKLWSVAVDKTDNPQLGLVAASIFQPAYLKGIGLAWMASENLEDGLQRFVNNSQLINTAMQIELEEHDEQLFIKYQSPAKKSPITKPHPCAIQLGVGFFLRMFRLAASKNIPATAVYFTFPIEDAQPIYEKYFQCPVHGSSKFNGISFSKQLLKEQLPTHDPDLVALSETAIKNHLEKMNSGAISAKVVALISQLIPSGCPTEETIAYELFMSKRTLQRKLSKEGKSYSSLLNDVRTELAKQHLSASKLPVSEVAFQLGYNSPSSFARAFKREVHQSPAEFRSASQ